MLRIHKKINSNSLENKKNPVYNNAQSLTEYVMLLGIVTLVFASINPLIKRAVQGSVKTVADQIGLQNESEQDVTSERSSFLEQANSIISPSLKIKRVIEIAGITTYKYEEFTIVLSNTVINAGFSERW